MRPNLLILSFLMLKLSELIYYVKMKRQINNAVIKTNIISILVIMKNLKKIRNLKHSNNNVINLKNFVNVIILNDFFFIVFFVFHKQ